jgi:hypothetical protein
MPTNRDFLFLFAALAIAGCLIMAGIVIYPDDRQMEAGVSAPQSSGGIGRIY